MIDNQFWKDAAGVWSWDAPSVVTGVKTGNGGQIDPELLKNPWDIETEAEIDFADIDFDATVESMLKGGNPVLNDEQANHSKQSPTNESEFFKTEPKFVLDQVEFDKNLDKETIPGYIECCRMLSKVGFSDETSDKYRELGERLAILQNSVEKFKNECNTDISDFLETYIPDVLRVAISYIEYENAEVDREIVDSVKKEMEEVTETLLIGVNDKIDEIHKYAAIEINAKAKALNMIMGSEGYVDPAQKL